MGDENWVTAAIADDSMVVELLVGLHRATPTPKKVSSLPFDWTVRQRRSKALMVKPTARTTSPTTPLSWSGGTSLSGGGSGAAADGCEESSRPPPNRIQSARSKIIGTAETMSSKRSRKRKTLVQLKEEEILLVEERKQLKRELATLRIVLEKQRAQNESLKKLKLDLQPQPEVEAVSREEEANPDETKQNQPSDAKSNDHEIKFELPDLNLPFQEDFNSEIL